MPVPRLRVSAAIYLLGLLTACGGGPRHIAAITPALSERLSGTWVLNAEESDDPTESMPTGVEGLERPDGAGRPATGGGGRGGGMPGSMPVRADWENGRVVVSRTVSGGGGVIETFMPSVDGTRLTVNVEVAGGPRGFEFQRVYNRAASP